MIVDDRASWRPLQPRELPHDSRRFSNPPFAGGSQSSQGRRGSASTHHLVHLGSSVDQVFVLKDGRKCLVKDRSGGLQMFDLRHMGRGAARTFVPPVAGLHKPSHAKFVLDYEENVIVSPQSDPSSTNRYSPQPDLGGESALQRARDIDGVLDRTLAETRSVLSRPPSSNGKRPDRIKVFSVATGRLLADVPTGRQGISLGRGTMGAPPHSRNDLKTRGNAELHFFGCCTGPDDKRGIFEGGVWPETQSQPR